MAVASLVAVALCAVDGVAGRCGWKGVRLGSCGPSSSPAPFHRTARPHVLECERPCVRARLSGSVGAPPRPLVGATCADGSRRGGTRVLSRRAHPSSSPPGRRVIVAVRQPRGSLARWRLTGCLRSGSLARGLPSARRGVLRRRRRVLPLTSLATRPCSRWRRAGRASRARPMTRLWMMASSSSRTWCGEPSMRLPPVTSASTDARWSRPTTMSLRRSSAGSSGAWLPSMGSCPRTRLRKWRRRRGLRSPTVAP